MGDTALFFSFLALSFAFSRDGRILVVQLCWLFVSDFVESDMARSL
jgi:hypothetical protein